MSDRDSYALLTLPEVCAVLRISRETAYRWLRAGRLKGVRFGRAWRFEPRYLTDLIGEGSPRADQLISADLFAGAGGLSLGFHSQGFAPAFFNEIDEESATTFQSNLEGAVPFVRPISDLTVEDVLHETGLRKGELDVLLGGPPCQGFSINAPLRTTSDSRNHLFRHYVRFLEGLQPKFVVFENVPGLVSFDAGGTLRDVATAFRGAGYEPSFRVLNACHYGVPQERWRLILVANRIGATFEFPSPTHYSQARPNFSGGSSLTFRYAIRHRSEPTLFDEAMGLRAPIFVQTAIGDLPPIDSAGGSDEMSYKRGAVCDFQKWARTESPELFNHHCVGLSSVNRQRMDHVRPGGSWRDIPDRLLPQGMRRARRSDHTRRYGRLHPEGIACTVMTKCDPHWGTVIHYEQDRVISVREAARFQSFPDKFRFVGKKASQYRQVGNAVPPLLADALAARIKSYLETVPPSRKRRSLSTATSGSRRI